MRHKILRLTLIVLCAATPAFAETAQFVRRTTQTNGISQLETCIRHYRPGNGNGPDIYLVGVTHLGDTNYFAALQKHLDAQPLVMFEGVGAAEAADRGIRLSRTNRMKATVGGEEINPSGLQTKLAKSLGLLFQLDALDYERPNFRNNDISLSKLREKFKGQDIDGDQFMKMLDGESGMMNALLAFLRADTASRGLMKAMLIEMLAEAGNNMDSIGALDANMGKLMQVILTERNAAIWENLKAELAKPDKAASISMIYGAGHMKELSERLENELHYSVADEQWLPAFSVNLKTTGVSEQQMALIRSFLRIGMQPRPPVKPPVEFTPTHAPGN